MLKYSFIEHPMSQLLKSLEDLLPGVKTAYALYTSIDKKVILNKYGEEEPISLKNKMHLVQKFRTEKGNHNWIRKDMLPFLEEQQSKKVKQLSLTDEKENNILCLKIVSPYDYLYDTFLIEINYSNFYSVSKEGENLTTEQKFIIEKLLFNAVKVRLETEYNNLKTHELIINSLKARQNKLQNEILKNKKLTKNYQKALDYFLAQVSKEISSQENIALSFSPACKAYLYQLDVSLETIHTSIINAVNVVQNLNIKPVKQIILEPDNLQIITPKETSSSVVKKTEKHNNVIEMLNKYEEAAVLCQDKGLKINGGNVARHCKPAITPAAITFNLKKYANVINLLTDKYDDKWTLLKKYFKPLQNVLENKGNKKVG